MAGRKVAVVINPALWRWGDNAEWEGKTFSHDEPVELTEEEYERASQQKVAYGDGEHQLLVRARTSAKAEAEAPAAAKS